MTNKAQPQQQRQMKLEAHRLDLIPAAEAHALTCANHCQVYGRARVDERT
jgi:hypothetical protein